MLQYRARPEACNFTKKESLAQVFSSVFYEIFRNTFFTEYLRTVSVYITRVIQTCMLFIYNS